MARRLVSPRHCCKRHCTIVPASDASAHANKCASHVLSCVGRSDMRAATLQHMSVLSFARPVLCSAAAYFHIHMRGSVACQAPCATIIQSTPAFAPDTACAHAVCSGLPAAAALQVPAWTINLPLSLSQPRHRQVHRRHYHSNCCAHHVHLHLRGGVDTRVYEGE